MPRCMLHEAAGTSRGETSEALLQSPFDHLRVVGDQRGCINHSLHDVLVVRGVPRSEAIQSGLVGGKLLIIISPAGGHTRPTTQRDRIVYAVRILVQA